MLSETISSNAFLEKREFLKIKMHMTDHRSTRLQSAVAISCCNMLPFKKINGSSLTNGFILERVILFLEFETYGTKNLITETIFEPKLEQIELAFLN